MEIRFTIHDSHFTKLHSTTVENLLLSARNLYKSPLFMQNKPNFRNTEMHASIYYTKAYSNETAFRRGKNKPNSNPIQTQTNPIAGRLKMNINSLITKDYENIYPCGSPKNKPNSNPIPQEPKMNPNFFVQKWLWKWCSKQRNLQYRIVHARLTTLQAVAGAFSPQDGGHRPFGATILLEQSSYVLVGDPFIRSDGLSALPS